MRSWSPDSPQTRAVVVAVGWGGCACFSAVVFVRRAVGAFATDLSPAAACATTFLLWTVCGLLLAVWPTRLFGWPERPRVWRALDVGSPLVPALLAAPAVLTAVAVTPLRPSAVALQAGLVAVGLWLLRAVWEDRRTAARSQLRGHTGRRAAAWRPGRRVTVSTGRTAKVRQQAARQQTTRQQALSQTAGRGGPTPSGPDGAGEEAEQLRLQQSRRSTARSDSLTGTLRLWFQAGQKTAVVHVPFSPPFPSAPQGEVRLTAGVGVRVKLGLVRAFGARVELRRSAAANAQPVELTFEFHWADASAHAAPARPEHGAEPHRLAQPTAPCNRRSRAS